MLWSIFKISIIRSPHCLQHFIEKLWFVEFLRQSSTFFFLPPSCPLLLSNSLLLHETCWVLISYKHSIAFYTRFITLLTPTPIITTNCYVMILRALVLIQQKRKQQGLCWKNFFFKEREFMWKKYTTYPFLWYLIQIFVPLCCIFGDFFLQFLTHPTFVSRSVSIGNQL